MYSGEFFKLSGMKIFGVLTLFLAIFGAVNWALWGFFQFDLVAYLVCSNVTVLARVIYAVVGVGSLWHLLRFS